MIASLFRRGPKSGAYTLIDGEMDPTLYWPVSQACTQAQFAEPAYDYWCEQIGEIPRTHRKQWEFCYILQALARCGMLAPGLRGLGFGVGTEPLASIFAARGVSILATDLEPDRAEERGWVQTAQHAASKQALNARALCDPAKFDQLVDFRVMDMNVIAPDLAESFDFCWSACALEHLGSIRAGLDFIANSLDCLKPGGVAVHTTELNCSSNRDTLTEGDTVLFRKRDFIMLAEELAAKGCHLTLNFEVGQRPLDKHVDVPPFTDNMHLKLAIGQFTSTSFGIIARKGAAVG